MFNKILSTVSVAVVSAMVLVGGSTAPKAATLLMVDGNSNNGGADYALSRFGDSYGTGISGVDFAPNITFTDTYSFNLDMDGPVVWQIDNSNDIPGFSNFGIADMTASWNGGTTEGVDFFVITNSAGVSQFPSNLTPPVNDWYMNMLMAGTNVLTFTGTSLSGGGTYSSFVTAVPLPPAALLFGTALFGIGALRRRKDKKAMDLAA